MVIPSLGATGGLERVATTLALALAPRVSRLVVCFAMSGPFEQTLEDAGIELVRIHRPRPRPDRLLRGAADLTRVLARERPEIVHAHNPAAGMAAHLARLAARSWRTAIVTTYHGLTGGPVRIAAHVMRASADLVISVGAGTTRELEAHGVRRIETIPNAVVVDPQRPATAVREELAADGAELLVSVGRYVRVKNQALLLDAVAKVAGSRRVRAVLVGDGPLEAELRARVAADGLADVVTLTGERSDAVDIVAASDVFVLSSDSEGLPLALLEAMSLGRPIVTTAVGSIPDTLEDGESALLVPPGDAGALAAALERVLADPELAARLGRGAAAAAGRFSVEMMVDATLGAYGSAVASRLRRATTRRSGARPS